MRIFVAGAGMGLAYQIGTLVVVEDPPFSFELHGTCAFRREFDYRG